MLFRTFFTVCALLLISLSAQAESKHLYLEAITDIPLMAGLVEMKDSSFTFDKPDGRLIETIANGKIAGAAVNNFYRETLPQLGWQETAPDIWIRDHEKLSITMQQQGNTTYVRFTLLPQKP